VCAAKRWWRRVRSPVLRSRGVRSVHRHDALVRMSHAPEVLTTQPASGGCDWHARVPPRAGHDAAEVLLGAQWT
jgi:hypothetical protein